MRIWDKFLKGYKKDKKATKAADNLVKLAMSLGKLKKTKEACTTFNKALKEFPDADPSLVENIELEKTQLSCS